MSAQWQRFIIEIPEEYTARERRAIAQDIIDRIVERTQDGKSKRGKQFAGYSKAYAESLNFKIAGKSKGDVNLTQSGDMLGALDILEQKVGSITIGFENGSPENGVADGNIRGTYGQGSQVGPKRDFLGITKNELKAILSEYPIKDDRTRKDNARISESSKSKTKGVDVEADD